MVARVGGLYVLFPMLLDGVFFFCILGPAEELSNGFRGSFLLLWSIYKLPVSFGVVLKSLSSCRWWSGGMAGFLLRSWG